MDNGYLSVLLRIRPSPLLGCFRARKPSPHPRGYLLAIASTAAPFLAILLKRESSINVGCDENNWRGEDQKCNTRACCTLLYYLALKSFQTLHLIIIYFIFSDQQDYNDKNVCGKLSLFSSFCQTNILIGNNVRSYMYIIYICYDFNERFQCSLSCPFVASCLS